MSPDPRLTKDFGQYFPDTRRRQTLTFFAHLNAKDLKNLAKCCAAAFACTILMFINPILQQYGGALFFAAIVTFIIPPAGVTLTILLGGLTMIVGMLLGWAWGVAVMKVALAARPAAETENILKLLGQETAALVESTGLSQSVASQKLLFEGFALDSRVTAIYFLLLCVFIYIMSRLRAANSKLALTQVFAIVVADMFLTNGPLVPQFLGTIPLNLIKPGLTAIAVSIVCAVFIFPESTSHLIMARFEEIIMPMRGVNELSLTILEKYPDLPNGEELKKTFDQLLKAYTDVEGNSGFLKLDLSYGRFNPDDILLLQGYMKGLVFTFIGLIQFHLSRTEGREHHLRDGEKKEPPLGQRVVSHGLTSNFQHDEQTIAMKKMMGVMYNKSSPLLLACSDALEATVDGIRQVNTRRWFNRPNQEQCLAMAAKRKEVLHALKQERVDFEAAVTVPASKIVDHFSSFDDKPRDYNSDLEGIVIGLAFESRFLATVDAIIGFLELLVHLETSRVTTRMWFPGSIRKAAAWVFRSSPTPRLALPGSSEGIVEQFDFAKLFSQKQDSKKKGSRIKDYENFARKKPIRQRSSLSKLALGVLEWLFNVEGIYALRVVIATVALGLPAVLPETAGFFYREKGLWALLMAQTSLMPYMAEFTSGFISKILGTTLGGVIGMAVWYTGSGLGQGNPYGLSAAMAVVVIFGMYFRLYVPQHAIGTVILTVATVYLVVMPGFSDSRLQTYASAGVGYAIFWRRILLVMVGCTAGAIISLFPRPTSATTCVVNSLAGILEIQASLFALFSSHPKISSQQQFVEETLLSTFENINTLQPMIQNLTFEFTASPWHKSSLVNVSELITQINIHLGSLTYAATRLTPTLLHRFEEPMGCKDEQIVADIMAVIGIIDLGMRTSRPLPAIMPSSLRKRVTTLHSPEERQPSKEMISMADARKYCTAISGWLAFLGALDELVMVLKEILGEWGTFNEEYVDLEAGS